MANNSVRATVLSAKLEGPMCIFSTASVPKRGTASGTGTGVGGRQPEGVLDRL